MNLEEPRVRSLLDQRYEFLTELERLSDQDSLTREEANAHSYYREQVESIDQQLDEIERQESK